LIASETGNNAVSGAVIAVSQCFQSGRDQYNDSLSDVDTLSGHTYSCTNRIIEIAFNFKSFKVEIWI